SVAGSPAVSGTDGVARITSWTLGGTAGANSLDATATGLGTVTFTATGTAEDPVTVIQSSPVVFATRLTQAFVRPTAVLN
ncbi:MAG TPA: hypothetical protein VMN03_05280, partial [Burkholderiales bacterium]|nr:hypothetical protein [Burkholderiales bacterium]